MAFEAPDLRCDRVGDLRVWRAGSGRPLVALAGPPTSAALFRHLARPLADEGWELIAPELFHPPPADASPAALAERVAAVVPAGAVVLSHGLAWPVAVELAGRAEIAGLAVINGPIGGVDPVTRVASGLARALRSPLAGRLVGSRAALAVLASSVGLRRAVTNPYAMDRDIVVMLCAPILATPAHRRAVVDYLGEICSNGVYRPPDRLPVLALWSASDLLYPLPEDPSRLLGGGQVSAICLPGARFLALEERPWEVSAALLAWARDLPDPPTTTRMS